MPAAIPVRIITPDQLKGAGEAGPYPIAEFERRCLAQGDSWFSIGALPPFLTTNLLMELELARGTCIVNCATPGAHLKTMVATTRSKTFLALLGGSTALVWDAVLLSGGGNDMIGALESRDADPQLRLLATQAEWGAAALGARRYVSEPGWATFATHLGDVMADLLAARAAGPNQATPIVLHTYDAPAPRFAPAGPGFGPWLAPAMQHFGVPQAQWNAVADELFGRLHALLTGFAALPNVRLVDTLGSLTKASAAHTGESGDWQNEIHPTRGGYDRLGRRWQATLDALFQ